MKCHAAVTIVFNISHHQIFHQLLIQPPDLCLRPLEVFASSWVLFQNAPFLLCIQNFLDSWANSKIFDRCKLGSSMASSTIKPGVLVALRELEPSSQFFKHGTSLRVTGKYVIAAFLHYLWKLCFSNKYGCLLLCLLTSVSIKRGIDVSCAEKFLVIWNCQMHHLKLVWFMFHSFCKIRTVFFFFSFLKWWFFFFFCLNIVLLKLRN